MSACCSSSVIAAIREDQGCPSVVASVDACGTLAVGTWDGFVATYKWDGVTLVHLASIKVFDSSVWTVTVFADGNLIVTGMSGKESAVFVVSSPASDKSIKAVRLNVEHAAVKQPASKISRKASRAKPKKVSSDDEDSSRLLPDVVSAACLCSPDILCFGDEDGAVWFYEYANFTLGLKKRCAVRDGCITEIIPVPAKRMLFAASNDGSFSVIDTRKFKAVAESKDYTEDIEAMILLNLGADADLGTGAFANTRLIIGTNTGRLAAHTWGNWGYPADGLLPRVHDRRSINNALVVDSARGVVATLSDERTVRIVDCSKPLVTSSTRVFTIATAQSLLSGLCLVSVIGNVHWLASLCSAETSLFFVAVDASDINRLFAQEISLSSKTHCPSDSETSSSVDEISTSDSDSDSVASNSPAITTPAADFFSGLD